MDYPKYMALQLVPTGILPVATTSLGVLMGVDDRGVVKYKNLFSGSAEVIGDLARHANLGHRLESTTNETEGEAQSDAENKHLNPRLEVLRAGGYEADDDGPTLGDVWEITWRKNETIVKTECGIVHENEKRGLYLIMRNADGLYKLMDFTDHRIVERRRIWRA